MKREILSGIIALACALAVLLVLASEESKLAIERVLHQEPTATVLFGGDMLFDRSVRTVMREEGGDFIFSCISETLREADLVVANLEGPIASNPSVSEGTVPGEPNNFRFTFDPSVAGLLFYYNIRLVNLGNNHVMNFGLAGLKETTQWLENANVAYFGDGVVYKMSLNGVPLAFVNYNEFGQQHPHLLEDVRMLYEEGNVVVVYAHWGEEYEEPLPRVEALARQFVDAGAALVVGSHPHVVQKSERYKEKFIYYSLGNFIFDQYFNDAVRNGLLLRVTFTKQGVEHVQELPVALKTDRRTCLI